VAQWYVDAGFEILDRNWRTRTGELDLVARSLARPGLVVVCEVKTRSSMAFGHPAEAVGPTRRRRIRALASEWLRATDVRAVEVRFDVAAVVGRRIEVVEEAF
jgi:putative endonuclease